ncbi:hypothetical protein [Sphingomonas sp.]|uniref:hypothetical protein n=1 Tax=Sphingomonas sp. TaxID=28214 RepID=UPI003F7242F7
MATLGTLFFMRRSDRREGVSDRPAIGLELRPASQGEEWVTLAINVRNRSDVRWELVSVELHGPDVLAAREVAALEKDGRGGTRVTAASLNAAMKNGPIAIGRMVQAAGSPRSQFSEGDSFWELVLFTCSSARTRLSIELILQSTEPNARPLRIKAQRNMPSRSR